MSKLARSTLWVVGTAGAVTLIRALVQLGAASRGSFHWGDAAIGAAGALGLVLVVLGAVLACPRWRSPQAAPKRDSRGAQAAPVIFLADSPAQGGAR